MPRFEGLATVPLEPVKTESAPAAAAAPEAKAAPNPTPAAKPAPKADPEAAGSKAADNAATDDKAADAAKGKSGGRAADIRKPEDVAKDATSMIIERVMQRGKHPKPEEKTDDEKDGGEQGGDKSEEKKDEKPEKRKPGRPKKAEATAASIYATDEAEATEEEDAEDKPAKKVLTTREDLVKLATESATRARMDAEAEAEARRQKTQPEAGNKPSVAVPKGLQKEAEKYHAVQLIYPEQYEGRDLVKELVEFNTAAGSYEKKWASDHPGEEFSWDDDEHDEWMESHAPDVDPAHVETAVEELRSYRDRKRAREDVMKEVQPILDEKRQEQLEKQHAGTIYKSKAETVTKIVMALAPDIGDEERVAELLREPDKLAAELDKDPIVSDVAQRFVKEAIDVIDTASRLQYGIVKLDLKEPDQQHLQNYLARLEAELSGLDEEDRPRMKDGRRFVTGAQQKKMKDPSGTYSVFDLDALKTIVTIRSVNLAKRAKAEQEERYQKYAESRGWVSKNNGASKETKAAARAAFVPAPSVSASSTSGKPTKNNGFQVSPHIPEGLAAKMMSRFR